MTVMEDAQILWNYHQLHHEPRNTDIAIGLGSHDIGVAEHAAELWHEGRFPLLIFTGANAPTTLEVFPRGEAIHYAERAQQLGVPANAILTETRATNTGENFTYTRELLDGIGIYPRSATVISRPYQQRRAYATIKRCWPQVDAVCSTRAQSLSDYIHSVGDANRVLNMLVGDTQRIWLYARRGFAIEQPIGIDTLAAYKRLIRAGFTDRIVGEERE
ncbi:YdcF family protein [Cellulosimicrobium sp. TH-20]|uniref:ElyC/SanA/YdcF family protein n=1 Tax=Cellulosimicrobium sp. TH-20 TaxID=1980001 RepID=UPI0015813F25